MAICSADFSPPGCTDERDVVSYLRSAGVTKFAITHGAAPIHFATQSMSGMIQVPEVEAVDTTGAGVIFHGAFCVYYASGCEFEQAIRKAAIVAAESCRYQGTRTWMDAMRNPDR